MDKGNKSEQIWVVGMAFASIHKGPELVNLHQPANVKKKFICARAQLILECIPGTSFL